MGLLSAPDARKNSDAGMATVGGIAIIVVVVVDGVAGAETGGLRVRATGEGEGNGRRFFGFGGGGGVVRHND